MKVSFYCQHVLGIGHFHRSLEICKALAAHHPTTLILGGPPVPVDHEDIKTLILPGLEMDPDFQTLVPCDPAMILAEVKEKRRELLFTHLQEEQPDVFVTELYPFGRKAFRSNWIRCWQPFVPDRCRNVSAAAVSAISWSKRTAGGKNSNKGW